MTTDQTAPDDAFEMIWVPRIGAAGTVWLRRLHHELTIARFCLVTFGVLEYWAVERLTWPIAVLGLPAGIAYLVFRQRAHQKFQVMCQHAGYHLDIGPDAMRYIPVRSPLAFDRWIARRDHPQWPRLTRSH